MMNRVLLAAGVLMVALGIENGVFPLLGSVVGVLYWSEVRLVATGIILLACLREGTEPLLIAFIAAALAGAVAGAGYVGPTILSFTGIAFISSYAVRWFFFERFMVRFFVLAVLIVLESLLWNGSHSFLWGTARPEIAWGTDLIVAFCAAGIYLPLKHAMAPRAMRAKPAGPRKRVRRR